MTERKTSLSRENGTIRPDGIRRGRRCHVCTGCGLCPGVGKADSLKNVRILTKDYLENGSQSLENEAGLRLIAADVGTTTIAMELCSVDGSVRDVFVTVNPQIQFGRDVLSRIQAAKDPALREQLQGEVREALMTGAKRFLKLLGEQERPLIVIAANTTMSYLLMGWDPEELGHAPFHASRRSGARFFLDEEETIPCVLLPGYSAFVGGDLFAGAMACGMQETEKRTLLIDLGTNGEILLGDRRGILATATAAGPAFEGGASQGVWGADLVKYVATLRREGLLDETGLLAEPYFQTGVRIGGVLLSQESVRGLQVAKAAIMAGIQILTKRAGVSLAEIDQVILAGGFGYFLNPADAAAIGLLPASLEEKTFSGGNTALAGAKRVGARMLRDGVDETMQSFTAEAEVINLAMEPEFQERYLKAMELNPME